MKVPSGASSIALVALTISLAGCSGHGLGVSSSTSSKTTAGVDSKVGSEQSLSKSQALKTTVSMPAVVLATAAMKHFAIEQLGDDPFSKLTHERMLNMPLRTLAAQEKASIHAAAAVFIVRAVQPVRGWPVSCFACAEQQVFARYQAQQVLFSNSLLSSILAAASASDIADPAAARASIESAFAMISDERLEAAWVQAGLGLRDERITFDFSGSQPAPVHFIVGETDVQGGPTGWKLARAGVAWFGEGKVSGRDVQLALDSSINRSMAQTVGSTTATGASVENGSGGEAGVK